MSYTSLSCAISCVSTTPFCGQEQRGHHRLRRPLKQRLDVLAEIVLGHGELWVEQQPVSILVASTYNFSNTSRLRHRGWHCKDTSPGACRQCKASAAGMHLASISQMVQVVSMEEVPRRLGSVSFQSKDVSGAQNSLFLFCIPPE